MKTDLKEKIEEKEIKPKLFLRPKDSIGERKKAEMFRKILEYQWGFRKGYTVIRIPGYGTILKKDEH